MNDQELLAVYANKRMSMFIQWVYGEPKEECREKKNRRKYAVDAC